MNELYKILGTLSIDTSEAEGKLDGAVGSAEKHAGKMSSIFQSLAQGVGQYIGQMFMRGVGQIGSFLTGVDEASGSLKSFASNMELAGKSSSEIKKAQDDMEKYAQATVYNTTDMLQTVGLLSTSGVKNATEIAKAMGNISSAAQDPEQALKSLSLQMTQVNGKGFIQTMDFRIMQEQASGPMKMVQDQLQKLNHWTPAQFQAALSSGKISADMFNKALLDVGGSATDTGRMLEKNATTPKTFGQAFQVVTESLQNSLIPVMEKLQNIFIPVIAGMADLAGTASGMLGSGINSAINWVSKLWDKLKENGAVASFSAAFESIKNITTTVSGIVRDFFKAITGGNTKSIDGVASAFKGVADFIKVATDKVDYFLDDLTGSMALNYLGDAFENIKSTIGIVIGVIGNFFSGFTTGGPSATSIIDGIVSGIESFSKDIAAVTGAIADFFDSFSKNQAALDGVKTALIAIGGAILAWKGYMAFWNLMIKAQVLWNAVTTAGSGIWTAFNAILVANPIGVIVTAIAALVAGLVYFFTQTDTGKKIWQDFMSWLNSAWQATASFFSGLWDGIVQTFNAAVAVIQAYVVPIFNAIATGIQTAMNIIWSVIQVAWQLISAVFQFVVGGIVAYIQWAWDLMNSIISAGMSFISGIITSVWNAIWGFLQPILSAIGSFFGSIWNGITSAISSALNSVHATITSVWNAIWGFLQPILSTIGNFIKNTWNTIKSAVTTAVNAVKSVISSVWNAISSTTSSVFNGVKSTVSSIWNSIKAAISGVVNSIKSTVSSVWNSISGTVSGVSRGISSTVSSIWNGLKGIVSGAMNGVHSTISGIIDKIKGLFNFHISFPKISLPKLKLPHFKISGDFNPLKGKIPTVGVDWYAKGGVMLNPTMFGMNGGNAMVGGEAGPEAILPLSDEVLSKIGHGIMEALGQTQAGAAGNLTFNQYNYSPENIDARIAAKLAKKQGQDMLKSLKKK